jgi:hypothetical protein
MSDGSGPSSRGSYASYDRDTRLWKTYQGSLFGGWETFSETWPNSGTMRNGVVFQRPQWVPLISEKESSLWRTPQATDGDHGGPNARDSGGGLHLSAQVHRWPTPIAGDAEGGARKPDGKRGAQLKDFAGPNPTRMWPTPTARDHKDTGANTDYQKIAAKSRLAGVVMVREKWPTPRAQDAKHGAATEWEMQTDHAGTKDPLRVHVAKKGDTGQLNPTWVEWLMGFPPHWTLVG